MLKLDPASRRDRLILRFGRIALALLAGAGAALVHPPFGVLPGLLGYPLLMLLAERSATPRLARMLRSSASISSASASST